MKVPSELEVGVSTHTGRVRIANEDDYLVLIPDPEERADRLFAIADGMGGVAGGAEASRAALRALGAEFLVPPNGDDDPVEHAERRMVAGFERAGRDVDEIAQQTPRLREMGTTLTAINVVGDRAVIGHVGDTRCVVLSGNQFEIVTEDHSVSDSSNLLTRCIGAGMPVGDVDVFTRELQRGDVLALLSDGVWNVVDDASIAEILGAGDSQVAAERLIERANDGGGPDNCTAVVVRVGDRDAEAPIVEVELPADELRLAMRLPPDQRTLRSPRWPLWLLCLSVVLGVLAVAKLVYGVDLLGRLM